MTASDDIDAYLAGLPDDQRTALQAVREAIAAAAPDAEEGFSYGAPAFRHRGRPVAGYSAAKSHLTFFPMSSEVIAAHQDQLGGWETSKGTVRFTPDRPLPASLVATLVAARLAELDAAGR